MKYCEKCGEPLQQEMVLMGIKKMMGRMCKCQIAEREAFAERMEKEATERATRDCFDLKEMREWTFDNDDGQKDRLTKFCKNYVDGFAEHIKNGKGVIFCGSLGTGKTYMASCIANALLGKGYRVKFTSLPELCRNLGSDFDGSKEANLKALNKYSLLILDDLGVERDTPTMLENAFTIIDSRIRSGKPLIVTTNLTPTELRETKDLKFARIYDRIIGNAYLINVTGESRRKMASKKLQKEVMEMTF